jgi:hypothetical protein
MGNVTRSLRYLREKGCACTVTEKWIPASPKGYKGPLITQDAFNFGDLLCAHARSQGALLVQTTARGEMNRRFQKIRKIKEARVWLLSGNHIHIHGWAKRGPRGKVKRWTLKTVIVTLELMTHRSIPKSALSMS